MKIHKYLAHVLLVARTMRTTMPLAFDGLGDTALLFLFLLSLSIVLLFWHIYLTFCKFRLTFNISRQLRALSVILKHGLGINIALERA